MYRFFVLLPLTLISLGIGWFLGSSPQVADYIQYATDIPNQTERLREVWVNQRLWAQIAAHVFAYAVLCFALVATVRTISDPLPPDHSVFKRRGQLFLEVVFVSLPSTVMLWILGKALRGDWDNPIIWFAVVVLCIGLVVSVAVTARRLPLDLYNSFAPPFGVTKTDMVAALCAIIIVATVAVFAVYPRDSTHLIGMFPVLMLMTAAAFFGVAAIFSRHASPVAVISSLTTGVLFLHLVHQIFWPEHQFRHREMALSSGSTPTVQAVKELRKIPDLATAFHQWLEYRRPAIEEYKKKGATYPVFFVSAQGGGVYAAYHPAAALARVTDYCAEFAHHLFGISSVSGGSLGAAVFAELVRSLPPAERGDPASPVVGCSRLREPTEYQGLQSKVATFFDTDFLSPVIASALLFDLPTALIPQLRLGYDRAQALEFGFEDAWRKLGFSERAGGLSADFFGRWEPAVPSPALFLATTGVNFGIPVLVSQIDWSYNPSVGTQAKRLPKGEKPALNVESSELLQTVHDRLNRPDELLTGTANILDFRPDLQLATSTAIGLSARFPFVTPPGTIVRNNQIAVTEGGVFQSIKELQLTDGGFYDNSGGVVAREIIGDLHKSLDRDERLKPFKNLISFHLIRFTNTPAKRQALASENAHLEFAAPLAAYDAVRLSRGVLLARPQVSSIANIYLLDEWYEGTLNWLLTKGTRENIDVRSSWLAGAQSFLCCLVQDISNPERTKRIPLSAEQVVELARSDSNLRITLFIANAREFDKIFRVLSPGTPSPLGPVPKVTPDAGAPAVLQVTPPPEK